ncbi:VWA domain-containing protein [Microbispora sp. NBC_01189]|uniref:vWA domain-containing protein n=1 Tax=Microbispora sp. NBC_01189 TaxID=2903583 RepID=UPI002E15EE79|nr:VWA domain-containing protein [Microbispora sp. NBC_01189]
MSEQVLPFYLVCDESYSMQGPPLDAINQQLPELYRAIATEPAVADRARLGIIAFSSTAEVLLPLADLNDVHSVPQLTPSGATNYGAAFSLLKSTIEQDVTALKQAGHVTYRPTVFFLTDGLPTDEWQVEHKNLVSHDFRAHPNILAFGFGDADPSTLQQVATLRAFIANDGLSPTQVLHEFARQLVNSVVNSVMASLTNPSGTPQIVIPDQVPGYTVLAADPL